MGIFTIALALLLYPYTLPIDHGLSDRLNRWNEISFLRSGVKRSDNKRYTVELVRYFYWDNFLRACILVPNTMNTLRVYFKLQLFIAQQLLSRSCYKSCAVIRKRYTGCSSKFEYLTVFLLPKSDRKYSHTNSYFPHDRYYATWSSHS